MIPKLRKMHYLDRLKQLNLPTLTYRRSRGDMIETYKLLAGKYDQQVALALPNNVTGECFTRGNSNKLIIKRCRYELRKNFFSNRIVNMWNSLTMSLCLILLILSKTDLMHIGNTDIFSLNRFIWLEVNY